MRVVCIWAVAIILATSGGAQTATSPVDTSVEITPSQKWTDTQIDLHPGDVVDLTASTAGNGAKACDPQGLPDVAKNGKLPIDSALPGALIAKLQDKSSSFVFVGAERRLKVTEAGRLYLGSNLAGSPPCSGNFSVKIHVVPANTDQATSIKSKLASAANIWLSGQFGGLNQQTAPNPGAAANPGSGPAANTAAAGASAVRALAVSSLPLASDFEKDLQSMPRRVNDEFKNLGDMVNFVLVGSEKQVQDALAAADWHVADTNNQGAAVKAILMATQKQDYLAMPMSQLYLFGRVQDFGYEQAEPYAMVASRHHFRIWKSPISYQGQPVWMGAGTHDIGFEKDQRNGKVTHKIDPAVDGERDHIAESLQQAGAVRLMNYFTPSEPVRETHNATGGGYHSDGRVLVIFLQ
jgi:hypothetical protein